METKLPDGAIENIVTAITLELEKKLDEALS
jgi:hypothetical protein